MEVLSIFFGFLGTEIPGFVSVSFYFFPSFFFFVRKWKGGKGGGGG